MLATVSADRTDALTAEGDSIASALTGGYHVAFLIAAVLVVASIAVGIFVCEEVDEQEMAMPEGAGPDGAQAEGGEPQPVARARLLRGLSPALRQGVELVGASRASRVTPGVKPTTPRGP